MRRWPRLKQHGIDVYRLREGIDDDLEKHGEEGFIEMIRRDDRPDIAKVVGAIHLLGRRFEIVTVANIAGVLDWPFPRVGTALCALRERKVVKRKKILNPYSPYSYRLDRQRKAPLQKADFTAAGNEDDPRADRPVGSVSEESPVDPKTAERVFRDLQRKRSDREEAA
jgi:hypothetical protein